VILGQKPNKYMEQWGKYVGNVRGLQDQ